MFVLFTKSNWIYVETDIGAALSVDEADFWEPPIDTGGTTMPHTDSDWIPLWFHDESYL